MRGGEWGATAQHNGSFVFEPILQVLRFPADSRAVTLIPGFGGHEETEGIQVPQQFFGRVMEDQDQEFIRVLEDLIEVLVAQGVITLDMLPGRAAAKFQQRRSMRELALVN